MENLLINTLDQLYLKNVYCFSSLSILTGMHVFISSPLLNVMQICFNHGWIPQVNENEYIEWRHLKEEAIMGDV